MIRLVALAALLVFAGCARDGGDKGPSATVTPVTPAQAQMPLCGDLPFADSQHHTDCRLRSADGAGLSFEVHHATSGRETTVTIDVIGRDGRRTQTITEEKTDTPAEPRLQDLDGDGRDELVVPRFLAIVGNEVFAVHRATGAATEFTRAGEVFGREIETTASGYIASSAHASADSTGVGFWKFDGPNLQPVVYVSIDPRFDADKQIVGFDCTVADKGGLAATGLSLDAAREKFCAEPIVGRSTPPVR